MSNIGSEHFIGFAGAGAISGLGVGAWEQSGAICLILLANIFVPGRFLFTTALLGGDSMYFEISCAADTYRSETMWFRSGMVLSS